MVVGRRVVSCPFICAAAHTAVPRCLRPAGGLAASLRLPFDGHAPIGRGLIQNSLLSGGGDAAAASKAELRKCVCDAFDEAAAANHDASVAFCSVREGGGRAGTSQASRAVRSASSPSA